MGAIRRARQGSSPHSAGYRSSACPWSCAEAHRSIPVERSRGCAARWSYNPSSLLGGLEQSDRRRTVGVHCERSQNGPLAAPFVTSVFVLHLVEARWRAFSEIGNADSEVRAVDDVRRAATQCIDLLPVAVTALFVVPKVGIFRSHFSGRFLCTTGGRTSFPLPTITYERRPSRTARHTVEGCRP